MNGRSLTYLISTKTFWLIYSKTGHRRTETGGRDETLQRGTFQVQKVFSRTTSIGLYCQYILQIHGMNMSRGFIGELRTLGLYELRCCKNTYFLALSFKPSPLCKGNKPPPKKKTLSRESPIERRTATLNLVTAAYTGIAHNRLIIDQTTAHLDNACCRYVSVTQ